MLLQSVSALFFAILQNDSHFSSYEMTESAVHFLQTVIRQKNQIMPAMVKYHIQS